MIRSGGLLNLSSTMTAVRKWVSRDGQLSEHDATWCIIGHVIEHKHEHQQQSQVKDGQLTEAVAEDGVVKKESHVLEDGHVTECNHVTYTVRAKRHRLSQLLLGGFSLLESRQDSWRNRHLGRKTGDLTERAETSFTGESRSTVELYHLSVN